MENSHGSQHQLTQLEGPESGPNSPQGCKATTVLKAPEKRHQVPKQVVTKPLTDSTG